MPKLCLYFPNDFEDEVWAKSSFCLSAPDGDHSHGRAGEWVLGRHPAADITLNVRSISIRHCSISYSYASNCWSIQDLGSTNGTRLNGKPLKPKALTPLNIGDHLHLGPNLITVAENEQDTENVGLPTVAATKALDHRTGAALEDNSTSDTANSLEDNPAPSSPKTYADTLYLGASWLIAPSTMTGKVYRLIVVGVAVAVVVLVMGGAS